MRLAILDSFGAVAVTAALTLPLGCVRVPPSDLQPLVAVAGQYAMLAQESPPAPAGACGTCGTKVPPGGGFVGDGRVKVPCPECNKEARAAACCDCGCDGKGYIVKPDGSRWACKCPPDCTCKGGTKCPTPPTGR
jgi:hypothetical protein